MALNIHAATVSQLNVLAEKPKNTLQKHYTFINLQALSWDNFQVY